VRFFRQLCRSMRACALLVAVLVAGCGYHAANSVGASPLAGGHTVAIPVFRNKTYRPSLELSLTESAVREFALRNGGKVVVVDDADLVLTATITSYVVTPVAYSALDRIKEYRLDISVEASLMDRASRRVVWAGKLSEGQDFPVDADINVELQLNREKAAAREIGRKLAQKLFLGINQAF
jgi:outer membrane lipopolysaccharide assembly protein LptE/RlpB